MLSIRRFHTSLFSSRTKAHFDWPLVILTYIMAVFGVYAVSIATFNINSAVNNDILNQIITSHYGLRQAIFLMISPITLWAVSSIPFELFSKDKSLRFLYFASLGLLILAFLGEKVAGISAFISIFWGFTIQPAEFAKIAIVIQIANLLREENDPFRTVKSSVKFITYVGLPIAITLMQGEMGSVIVMVAIVIAMLFMGGFPWKRFIMLMLAGALGIVIIVTFWSLVKPDSYRLERIMALVRPEVASDAAKYQVNNSIIAIGSGGLHGVGAFVPGSVYQLDYVPKDWTDFIFAAIGESYGFVGACFVIVLYALIIFRLLYLARFTENKFGELIIMGIMTMFLIHVFINIGMTIGIMPVAGIPLPFLSYGGSNMMTNMMGIGLVLNVTKNRSLTFKKTYNTSYLEKRI